jgi:alpha-ketoglutarate-dependent taurine dioxygenase
VNDPFDLSCEKAYIAWRARKLRAYPADIADLRVSIERLDRPAAPELAALRDRVETFNMALVQTDPARIDKESLLAFTRSLGLVRTDANLFADASAVSSIAATPRASGNDTPSTGAGSGAAALGDFIPYTNKPLSWHTDGYYNDQDSQVGAWCLFCVRAARDGGENGLIDHEMAYIGLRDESPQHITALCHPQALIIPAHIQDGRIIRPESVGPVFSCRDGHLHMRYSARGRNVLWRDTPDTHAAREALDRLFSQPDVFTFRYRLRPGEGLVSNNVLHCRSGFEDEGAPGQGRLLYRVRFLDRIAID